MGSEKACEILGFLDQWVSVDLKVFLFHVVESKGRIFESLKLGRQFTLDINKKLWDRTLTVSPIVEINGTDVLQRI